ncbi:hypothetical protein EYF80_018919 [Liparis tanakae]|uniref:Uncharacterized protein n=1 Tax=Liparis tanakae TaxID=230148 RepID=A0A4Z2I135_9TELE|nr:hypothetical protein EYF80_018919 [Liparis tanakae]
MRASICPKLFINPSSGSGSSPSRRWVPGGPTGMRGEGEEGAQTQLGSFSALKKKGGYRLTSPSVAPLLYYFSGGRATRNED